MSSNASFEDPYEGVVRFRSGKPPGDGYEPGERPFAKDAYDDSDTRTRSSRDRDSYEPSQYGARRYAARDGYAPDQTSEAYEERQVGTRGYQVPAIAYRGNDRRRSYDDNDVDDYYERSRVSKYRRDSDRMVDRARSHSHRRRSESRRRGSGSDSDSDEHHGHENTEVKKWGATLAGAAIGGFTAHKAKKGDNWVPAAIGAVIGGLVGREVEKEVYKRKEHRREEKELEEKY